VIRILAALLLVVCGAGCSTVGTLASGSEDCYLYSGTRQDLRYLRGQVQDCTGLTGIFGCFDIPWSLALDTALVPVTAPLELILGSPRKKKD